VAKRTAPTLLAMVLCDTCIIEQGSFKYTLVGTFTKLQSPFYPFLLPKLTIYLVLTEGRGKSPLMLRMVNVSTGQVTFDIRGEIWFNDPLALVEAAFPVGNIKVDAPGPYSVEVWVGNDLVAARRLDAIMLYPPTAAPAQPAPDGAPKETPHG